LLRIYEEHGGRAGERRHGKDLQSLEDRVPSSSGGDPQAQQAQDLADEVDDEDDDE
jgi:hypothetical protein